MDVQLGSEKMTMVSSKTINERIIQDNIISIHEQQIAYNSHFRLRCAIEVNFGRLRGSLVERIRILSESMARQSYRTIATFEKRVLVIRLRNI